MVGLYWELVSQHRVLGVVSMMVDSIEYDRIGLNPSLPDRPRLKRSEPNRFNR